LLASLAVTWIAVFISQLAIAPSTIYWSQVTKIGELELIARGAEQTFQNGIEENYANVRIADNPSIHETVLNGTDRQKFLGLLSAGKLTAWARPMAGKRDFVRISPSLWETHLIDVQLNSGISVDPDNVRTVHHQSYLKNSRETTHYDVCVNYLQMSKIWGNLTFLIDDGRGE
jgi:hypothetical protein